jgi:hypothetical protein
MSKVLLAVHIWPALRTIGIWETEDKSVLDSFWTRQSVLWVSRGVMIDQCSVACRLKRKSGTAKVSNRRIFGRRNMSYG